MEVMVAAQSGALLHALRVQLKRRVSARRGGDYNEVPFEQHSQSTESVPFWTATFTSMATRACAPD
jgi:hypothetical protein